MARAKTTAKTAQKAPSTPGKCRDCVFAYDWHERTAYAPHEFFLCKCQHEEWSQFLDHPCVNGKFKHK